MWSSNHQHRAQHDGRVRARSGQNLPHQRVVSRRRMHENLLARRVKARVGNHRKKVVPLAFDDDEFPGFNFLDAVVRREAHFHPFGQRSPRDRADFFSAFIHRF